MRTRHPTHSTAIVVYSKRTTFPAKVQGKKPFTKTLIGVLNLEVEHPELDYLLSEDAKKLDSELLAERAPHAPPFKAGTVRWVEVPRAVDLRTGDLASIRGIYQHVTVAKTGEHAGEAFSNIKAERVLANGAMAFDEHLFSLLDEAQVAHLFAPFELEADPSDADAAEKIVKAHAAKTFCMRYSNVPDGEAMEALFQREKGELYTLVVDSTLDNVVVVDGTKSDKEDNRRSVLFTTFEVVCWAGGPFLEAVANGTAHKYSIKADLYREKLPFGIVAPDAWNELAYMLTAPQFSARMLFTIDHVTTLEADQDFPEPMELEPLDDDADENEQIMHALASMPTEANLVSQPMPLCMDTPRFLASIGIPVPFDVAVKQLGASSARNFPTPTDANDVPLTLTNNPIVLMNEIPSSSYVACASRQIVAFPLLEAKHKRRAIAKFVNAEDRTSFVHLFDTGFVQMANKILADNEPTDYADAFAPLLGKYELEFGAPVISFLCSCQEIPPFAFLAIRSIHERSKATLKKGDLHNTLARIAAKPRLLIQEIEASYREQASLWDLQDALELPDLSKALDDIEAAASATTTPEGATAGTPPTIDDGNPRPTKRSKKV